MKLAIISDLHPLHWKRHSEMIFNMIVDSCEREKPDVLIDAGDWEDHFYSKMIADSLGIPQIRAYGNHDYYGQEAPGLVDGCMTCEIDGVKFTVATLWGDLDGRKPDVELAVMNYLADFKLIAGMTTKLYADLHQAHRNYIAMNPADVVVTHHLPSFDCVHDIYKTETNFLNNWGFASHCEDLIETVKPKLWVHGHTHIPLDFMKGETRIVCNPLGYPGERHIQTYEPVFVEI